MINNGFRVLGYTITTVIVDHVDNDGEPCQVCQMQGHVIDCNVYGVEESGGMSWNVESGCCSLCVPDVVGELSPEADVTIELSMVAVTVAFDARMSHQDDNRPHPDAI